MRWRTPSAMPPIGCGSASDRLSERRTMGVCMVRRRRHEVVPGERFELPTNGLQNRCSTTELTRQICPNLIGVTRGPQSIKIQGCGRFAPNAVRRPAGPRQRSDGTRLPGPAGHDRNHQGRGRHCQKPNRTTNVGRRAPPDGHTVQQEGLLMRKPQAPRMSKEAMREESERLVKEAMERKIVVTQGKTRIEAKCGKCGAPNRVAAAPGELRVQYTCKECGHDQKTL
jgi:hypothetical protein